MAVVKPSSEEFYEDSIQESPNHQSKIDEKPFKCENCGRNFKEKFNLKQHMEIHLGVKPFSCNECKKQFSRKHSLERHKKSHLKISKIYKCVQCPEEFSRKRDLLMHIKKMHAKPSIRHKCEQCPEDFSRKSDLMNHKKKMHAKASSRYNCEQCPDLFTRKSDLLKHMKKVHPKHPEKYSCRICTEKFRRKADFHHHLRTSHPYVPKAPSENVYAEKVKHLKRINALNVFSATYFESEEENDKDFSRFFNSIRSDLQNELNFQLHEKRRFKWFMTVKVLLSRTTADGEYVTISPHFRSKNFIQLSSENISTNIEEGNSKIISSFDSFNQNGSNWKLERILHLELSSVKYNPFYRKF